MLVNGVRFCDACIKPITSSDECVTSSIPRETAPLFLALFSQTENAGKPHIRADGTVELTVCRQCESTMATLPDKLLD